MKLKEKQYFARLHLLQILSKNKYFSYFKINFNYIKHKKKIIDELE